MNDLDSFRPRSRGEWRAWLSANHDDSPGVWVVYARKGTGEPTLSYEDSVLEALCFGWIDGLMRSVDEVFYRRRFTPRKPRSKWSPSNKRRVERLAGTGLMTPAGQAAIDRAKRDGTWSAPDRPTLPDVPTPEFAAALDGNRRARATFDALTPGRKRQYVHWIASAKRAATVQRRIERALALLEEGKPLGVV